MIRASVLFLQITVLVFVGVWLASEPGTVTIIWRDWRLDSSVGILVLSVVLIGLGIAIFYRFLRFLRRAPSRLLASHRLNRERKGYRELTLGMVALAAGDATEALLHARRSDKLLGKLAAGHLLIAQAASMQGNKRLAKQHFEAIDGEGNAGIARLKGLFEQALISGNDEEARHLGEQIHAKKPDADWILLQLFDLQVNIAEWAPADRTLNEAISRKLVEPKTGKKLRSVVLFERGKLASELNDSHAAVGFFREAHDLDPAFVLAAIEYAIKLRKDGKKRRASSVLEQTWSRIKHPDIVKEYVLLHSTGLALDQFKAAQKLIAQKPQDPDGDLILAKYAFDAQLWGLTRNHLVAALKEKSSASAYMLMAELAEKEKNDVSAGKHWRERALSVGGDNAWVCNKCGTKAEHWGAHCLICGAFASMLWAQSPESCMRKIDLSEPEIVPLLEKVETQQ